MRLPRHRSFAGLAGRAIAWWGEGSGVRATLLVFVEFVFLDRRVGFRRASRDSWWR